MVGLTNMLGQVWISATGSNLVTGDWAAPGEARRPPDGSPEDHPAQPPVGTTTATTFVHFVHFPAFVRHTG